VRSQSGAIWTVPEIGALPRDAHGLQVREGRDLITATYAHIGPNVPDESKRYAGNNLACSNCHLQAGTKKFGLPLFGLYGDFPQYSARSGDDISIEDRINSCMTRSMNGRPLPTDAPEMMAIVAYIKFLSSGVPSGQQLPGLGTGRMQELNRAADPTRGRPLYARICATCHEPDGSGVSYSLANSNLGYVDPPLWGAGSFNDGAGMARIITFANFIHFNMPHGTDYLDTRLSIEEAWDIAAFVLSQQRRPAPASRTTFPTCCLSRWTCPTALTQIISARGSINLDRLRRSALKSSFSRKLMTVIEQVRRANFMFAFSDNGRSFAVAKPISTLVQARPTEAF
jgi:thiosulfate dehydrogenase